MNESQAHVTVAQVTRKRAKMQGDPEHMGRMVTVCQSMHTLFDQVRCFAPSEMHILIQGETGSGKELCAEAIHQYSQAHTKSWVAVNCAALPPAILLAELFGCDSGAFTNAKKRKGLILSAHRGTLFLDEVGELSLEAQAALLRVLETGEMRALGSDRVQKVKIRLICATHRDLPLLVQQGQFRADLYHRISAVTLCVPPLRDRLNDLSLIVTQMALPFAIRLNSEAWSRLQEYHWPGNVRELKNLIERVQIMSPHGVLTSEHLGLPEMMKRSADGTPPLLLSSTSPDVCSRMISDSNAGVSHLTDTSLGVDSSQSRTNGDGYAEDDFEGNERLFTPRSDKFLISGAPNPRLTPPDPEPPQPPRFPPAAAGVESTHLDDQMTYASFEGMCPLHNLEFLFTVIPPMSLESLKQSYTEHLLRRFDGNISQVARVLEVSRNQVYRRQDPQEPARVIRRRSKRSKRRSHQRRAINALQSDQSDGQRGQVLSILHHSSSRRGQRVA